MIKFKALLFAGLVLTAFASPALGDTSSVDDPKGDGNPDILKLVVENNQSTLVLRQKYVKVESGQVHTINIKWGEPESYSVQLGNFDSDPGDEKQLNYNTANSGGEKPCPDLVAKRNMDTDVVIFRVPRSCIGKAPNVIFGKGFASFGQFSSDQTRRTARTPRG
jgi:hypothetical protein